MDRTDRAEALLIGGRAGVGRTTVGWEVSARAPAGTVRVAADGRSVPDIAEEVLAAGGWAARQGRPNRPDVR
ncbi:hypothetical protein G9272_04405 [Streptomyces asoensis]|uniref:Uncharacterized protein n=1 Tax=Streptomyces asoensis TaxID=249586 RepID=A0A6M4X1H7_9ACTN|nr:hypothetical protein G9272_04405 [Streptomyces asoensis]